MSSVRSSSGRALEGLRTRSLGAAARAQGLTALAGELERIVPDIANQYSDSPVDTPYLRAAVRGLHAFQTRLGLRAVREAAAAAPGRTITVVDIGDSAGTHLRYLTALADVPLRTIGVNLDEAAVERIREAGVEGLAVRAEELPDHGVDADVFLSFETFEHLHDPFRTLRELSYRTRCVRFAFTVPLVRASRLGLHHLRGGDAVPHGAEDTHVLELSPGDWELAFRHTGWRALDLQEYLQYPPRTGVALRRLWAATTRFGTHEGFVGALLERDHSWSDLYRDW
jgi:SAM-dependent methyltransferase